MLYLQTDLGQCIYYYCIKMPKTYTIIVLITGTNINDWRSRRKSLKNHLSF